MSPRVQVLLSTYNGAKYLPEQLASLAAQRGVSLSILARDDGSKDNSAQLVDDFSISGQPCGRLASSGNVGVIASFFDLLKNSDPTADYFAFCDQDDVWDPAKLEVAVGQLEKFATTPALYFGRLAYVDAELRPLGLSRIPNRIRYESALVENVATGCSVVFNRALRDELVKTFPERNCLMHDWWAYLAAQALGEVVYDAEPWVRYRQHGQNVVGASNDPFQVYLTKVQRFIGRGGKAPHVSDQAREFLRCFGDRLPVEKRRYIEDFLASKRSLWSRAVYALRLPLRRQSLLDNLIFRVLILLGRY